MKAQNTSPPRPKRKATPPPWSRVAEINGPGLKSVIEKNTSPLGEALDKMEAIVRDLRVLEGSQKQR